jgi:hypothetical protein
MTSLKVVVALITSRAQIEAQIIATLLDGLGGRCRIVVPVFYFAEGFSQLSNSVSSGRGSTHKLSIVIR